MVGRSQGRDKRTSGWLVGDNPMSTLYFDSDPDMFTLIFLIIRIQGWTFLETSNSAAGASR